MKKPLFAALILLSAAVIVSPAHALEKSTGEWLSEANLALAANPWDAKAYYNRGTGFYGSGDYEAAIRDLSMTIALEPGASDAYYNRGLSYRKQHKRDDAISDFEKAVYRYSEAIRFSPDDADLYFMRGSAFLLKGDWDEAFADSVRALRIEPDHASAWRLLREALAWKNLNLDTSTYKPGE